MAYEILNTCMLVEGISVDNCSGWVQAWGSVIAIGFAAWIAGKEDRRRHREASALARLATQRVMLMTVALRAVTESMSESFSNFVQVDCDPRYFTFALDKLKQLPLPTDEQILRISVLDFSLVLAEGLSAFDTAISRLSFIDKNLATHDSVYRKNNAELVHEALMTADILLNRAITAFRFYVAEQKPIRGEPIILTPLKPLTFIKSVKSVITGCIARIKRKLIVRN